MPVDPALGATTIAQEYRTMAKTTCPVTREQFRAKAPAMLEATVDGQSTPAMCKEFQTGSLGWNYSGKVTILVDGVPTVCQVGLNVTIVGSKELPQS